MSAKLIETGESMISLTENAAKEILKIMQESDLNEEVCLRVGVKGGGCSGFTSVSYTHLTLPTKA